MFPVQRARDNPGGGANDEQGYKPNKPYTQRQISVGSVWWPRCNRSPAPGGLLAYSTTQWTRPTTSTSSTAQAGQPAWHPLPPPSLVAEALAYAGRPRSRPKDHVAPPSPKTRQEAVNPSCQMGPWRKLSFTKGQTAAVSPVHADSYSKEGFFLNKYPQTETDCLFFSRPAFRLNHSVQ